uniref:Uncharacterized protein n=1 Tax=Oryza glumipatula TaxID=40148 RepID=A0A0D9YEN5_9ORYZ
MWCTRVQGPHGELEVGTYIVAGKKKLRTKTRPSPPFPFGYRLLTAVHRRMPEQNPSDGTCRQTNHAVLAISTISFTRGPATTCPR